MFLGKKNTSQRFIKINKGFFFLTSGEKLIKIQLFIVDLSENKN